MSEDAATDLDDYVDAPIPLDPSDAMTLAKADAMAPKPTLREMIDTVTEVRGEIEDAQLRLLITGARTDPYKPYMRRAAVLASAVNFLLLIDAKQDAVKRALGSRS